MARSSDAYFRFRAPPRASQRPGANVRVTLSPEVPTAKGCWICWTRLEIRRPNGPGRAKIS
eukprot:217474-Pyramimonas_sp.AAC.1